MNHGQKTSRAESPSLSAVQQHNTNTWQKSSDYDFIFPNLKSFRETHAKMDAGLLDETLKKLSKLMKDIASSEDKPNDNKRIPAGYTYLGQLVVHDITQFSSFTAGGPGKQKGQNLRTPALELDSIYGGGPGASAVLYEPELGRRDRARCFFRMGAVRVEKSCPHIQIEDGAPNDLPRLQEDSLGLYKGNSSYQKRKNRSSDPIIADPRNDDHLIISQLQTLFMKLHNSVVSILKTNHEFGSIEAFTFAHKFVVQCYRDVVLHDLLKRLLPEEFYDDLCAVTPRYLCLPEGSPIARDTELLSLEFVMAGARVGHSMVRNNYSVNRCKDGERLIDLFGQSGAAMIKPLSSDWVIDWSHFFGESAQFSRKIAPFVSEVFRNRKFPTDLGEKLNLNELDIFRSREIPCGQELAKALKKHFTALSRADPELPKIDVPALKGPEMLPVKGGNEDEDKETKDKVAAFLNKNPTLRDNCPLYYYILQEADNTYDGEFLGPLGAYVVGLAFQRLLPAEGRGTPIIVGSMPDLIELSSSKTELEREVNNVLNQS